MRSLRMNIAAALTIPLMLIGCDRRGYVLEIHSAKKPNSISFVVDTDSGQELVKVGKLRYRVDLGDDGKVILESMDKIEEWHREVLVVDGRVIEDFYLTNSKVSPAYETAQGPNGETIHRSVPNGSKITYDVIYTQ